MLRGVRSRYVIRSRGHRREIAGAIRIIERGRCDGSVSLAASVARAPPNEYPRIEIGRSGYRL